jgi:hypothetical protein
MEYILKGTEKVYKVTRGFVTLNGRSYQTIEEFVETPEDLQLKLKSLNNSISRLSKERDSLTEKVSIELKKRLSVN